MSRPSFDALAVCRCAGCPNLATVEDEDRSLLCAACARPATRTEPERAS